MQRKKGKAGKNVKKSPKKKAEKTSREGKSHWGPIENKRYIDFLVKNKDIFLLSLQKKKEIKIYVLMSKHIKVRDSLQCRSHHQKMLIKENTIDGIIEKYSTESQVNPESKKMESEHELVCFEVAVDKHESSEQEDDLMVD